MPATPATPAQHPAIRSYDRFTGHTKDLLVPLQEGSTTSYRLLGVHFLGAYSKPHGRAAVWSVVQLLRKFSWSRLPVPRVSLPLQAQHHHPLRRPCSTPHRPGHSVEQRLALDTEIANIGRNSRASDWTAQDDTPSQSVPSYGRRGRRAPLRGH